MATEKSDKKNGKISLYPLKSKEAVKDILNIRPPEKHLPTNHSEQQQERVNED